MSDASDTPSPWSGDDVRVSARPPIVWNEADTESSPHPQSSDGPNEAFARLARRPLALAALAVVVVLVVGFVVWPRDAGDDAQVPPIGSDLPATTSGTLPDQVEESTDAVEDTEPTVVSGTSEQSIDRVELPAAVAAIAQPTELIVQSIDRRIHTISLPSGNVRTVDLGPTGGGQSLGGATLIAGPDAAMLGSYDSPLYIIPRSGVPLEVDRAQFGTDRAVEQITPYGWISDESDGAVFVVAVYDPATDTQQSFQVSTDGTVVGSSAAPLSSYTFPIAAQGVQLVNDAGGAYRLAFDGTAQRITDGTVIGASETDVLIRRCDELRNCRVVLRPIGALDGDPDERLVDVPESLGSRYYGVSLSPDGSAVSYTIYGATSQRVTVDLEQGGVIEMENESDGNGAWAPDGSGEFTAFTGPGIAFLDHKSGEPIFFAEELGPITSVAARYPDSELVDTSIPTSSIGFSTPPEGDVGIDLVAVGQIGSVTLIDLDDATASSWNAPTTPGLNPPRLIADGAEVIVLSANANAAFVATYGTAQPLDAESLPAAPIFAGPDGRGLWARSFPGDASVDQIARTIDGGPIAQDDASSLKVENATLIGDDGAGSIVFERGGSIYTSSGGEPTLLTTGELLALGTDSALVRECDEQLNCALHVLDRESGERSPVTGESVVNVADGADAERDVSLAGSMSPDGAVALVSLTGVTVIDADDDQDPEPDTWAFIDSTTSEMVLIDAPTDSQPVVWNADSTYAAFTSDDSIRVFERSTYSIFEITGIGDVRGFAAVGPEFWPAEPVEPTN